MATKQLAKGVAKVLHEQNKRAFKPLSEGEGISFDAFIQNTKPVPLCPKCGGVLELDLFSKNHCPTCKKEVDYANQ
jgi:Zn finger protein HypA/HybF involved in hydrogenase expression